MANILGDEEKQQIPTPGRLEWPLRRIEQATGVRRGTVTVENVLNEVVPIGGYARLVEAGGDAERFFRRATQGWMSMSESRAETFMDFARAYGDDCGLSPLGWTASAVGSRRMPLGALVAFGLRAQ